MTALIWRDIENNKVYVKYGTETMEVPHAIAEAYRQEEARDFRLIYSVVDSLKAENAELRELVRSYESLSAAMCNERDCAGCPFDSTEHVLCEHMRLVACMGELGIEVDE